MARKTQGVQDLVNLVLPSCKKPYCEDITDEVCLQIEKNQIWKAEYDFLVSSQKPDVVNNWIARYVAQAIGRTGNKAPEKATSSLIKTYAKLLPPP